MTLFTKTTSLAFVMLIASTLTTTAMASNHNQKTKYGVTVTTCGYDYDDENFCANSRMKTFAKVMSSRPANFNKNMLLYIYNVEGDGNPMRVVAMDKQKKTVTPLYWSLQDADTAVNSKGDLKKITFSKNSNEFCFKGNIMAYRNAYSYDPKSYPEFCYDYDRKKQDFGWFKQ